MAWVLEGRRAELPVRKPDALTLGQCIYLHEASLPFAAADERNPARGDAILSYGLQVNATDVVSAGASAG